jgi:hypothetical protein
MKLILLLIALPLLATAVFVAFLYLLPRYIKPPEKTIRGDITILSAKSTRWVRKLYIVFTAIYVCFLPFLAYEYISSGKRDNTLDILTAALIIVLSYSAYGFASTYTRLKEVGYGRDFIFVSNFKNDIRVPFSDIEKIWTENKYSGGDTLYVSSHTVVVFISLKRDTIFGRKFFFMPYKGERLSKGEEHSVSIELQNLINNGQ